MKESLYIPWICGLVILAAGTVLSRHPHKSVICATLILLGCVLSLIIVGSPFYLVFFALFIVVTLSALIRWITERLSSTKDNLPLSQHWFRHCVAGGTIWLIGVGILRILNKSPHIALSEVTESTFLSGLLWWPLLGFILFFTVSTIRRLLLGEGDRLL